MHERLILGIDPGFGRIGYAVLSTQGIDLRLVVCDAIVTPSTLGYPQRLQQIYEQLVRRFGAHGIPPTGRRG